MKLIVRQFLYLNVFKRLMSTIIPDLKSRLPPAAFLRSPHGDGDGPMVQQAHPVIKTLMLMLKRFSFASVHLRAKGW